MCHINEISAQNSDLMGKQKITMTIDEKIFSAFKRTCNSNAMKVSSKVELMMLEFVEQKISEYEKNNNIKNKNDNNELKNKTQNTKPSANRKNANQGDME